MQIEVYPSRVVPAAPLTGVDTPKECAVCGAPLPVRRGRGRRRVYCGDRCRNYQRAVNQLVVVFFMIGRMGEGSYNLPIVADR